MKRLCAFVAFLLLSALPAGAQSTIERTIGTSGVAVVQVNCDSGDVVLRQGAPGSVAVRAVATSRSNTVVVKISATRQGPRLLVTLHGRQQTTLPFASGSSQRYEITYPPGVRIDLRAFSGNVSADDLSVPLVFYAGHGTVTLSAPHRDVTGSSDDGSITVTNAHAVVDVLAQRGSIDVALAAGWDGKDVRMQSDTGNLHLTVPKGLRAHVDASSEQGQVDNALRPMSGPLLFLFARTGNVNVSESDN